MTMLDSLDPEVLGVFVKNWVRMCDLSKNFRMNADHCRRCPLKSLIGIGQSCTEAVAENPKEALDIIKKWSKENPEVQIKKFEFVHKVSGYFKTIIEAETFEKASKMAERYVNEADFGDLNNVESVPFRFEELKEDE